MPPKSNKKRERPQYGNLPEEMSDATPLMEQDIEEEDSETAGEKTNEEIMKAITSLKSGLYKKIDSLQLTVTEVKKQVQEGSHMAHVE